MVIDMLMVNGNLPIDR